MTAQVIALADRRAPAPSQHYLLFTQATPMPGMGPVRGCACGFRADLEEDFGWGDSVTEHLIDVGRGGGV